MTLPKQLIESFEEIKASPLVSGDITKENVQTFVDALNRAIPSPMNQMTYTVYRFNRIKYLADKQRFINDVKEFTPYDALILWTDFKDILSFFKLEGKIFLGWDKSNNRYRAYIHSQAPQIQILRRGETLSGVADQKTLPTELNEKHFALQESIDDDMDRIYLHMQDRLMAVTKQLNSIEE